MVGPNHPLNRQNLQLSSDHWSSIKGYWPLNQKPHSNTETHPGFPGGSGQILRPMAVQGYPDRSVPEADQTPVLP